MFTPGRRTHYRGAPPLSFPDKANRVLNLILVVFVLILVRIWTLSVIQNEKLTEEARRPQHREVLEPSNRGTIRDRFNLPLAINKMRYQAAIYYSHLKDIPGTAWETDAQGNKVKKYKRKEYITELSNKLGKELQLDPERIEDLIYSKAAFYFNIPYVIKEDISEKEYYRLRMLEKDWPGIYVMRVPRRTYPMGKTGSDVIGYMGAINRSEYDAILKEMRSLQEYLKLVEEGQEPPLPPGMISEEDVQVRLEQLQAHAYTVNDYVGKAGVEAYYERDLRGYHGKRFFYSDAKGNFLRELPGSTPPESGNRLLLTISSELQEYAEQLLAANEKIREEYEKETAHHENLPWMRGGAIVAMDPYTGEILALAAYPNFNPNDFVPSGNADQDKEKQAHIRKWLENETYLAEVWDQKRPLVRERFDLTKGKYLEDVQNLSWERYLEFLLPTESPVRKGLDKIHDVQSAVRLQQLLNELLVLSGQDDMRKLINLLYHSDGHVVHRNQLTAEQTEAMLKQLSRFPERQQTLKSELDRYLAAIPHNYDKLLTIDLCRLCVAPEQVSPQLLAAIGSQTLSSQRQASSSFVQIQAVVKELVKEQFHDVHFKEWRKQNEKEFLKAKRADEKAHNLYAKPYIDYLDREEAKQFTEFWDTHKWNFFNVFVLGIPANSPELKPYNNTLLQWHKELADGAHQAVAWWKAYQDLQRRLSALQPSFIEPYLQALRGYADLNRPLYGRYRFLRNGKEGQLEKHLATAFYPVYGYGYTRSQAYRQAATQGSVFKLVTAHETLMQNYQRQMDVSGKVGNLNPLEIDDRALRTHNGWIVAYSLDGKPLHQNYKGGKLTKSLRRDIGRIDMVGALESSSNPYFSLLAGDFLEHPEDLARAARDFSYGARTGIDLPGEYAGKVPSDIAVDRTGLYSFAFGQHSLVVTPLQTAVMLGALVNGGRVLKPKVVLLEAGKEVVNTPVSIKREIPMPKQVFDLIYRGMQRVTAHIFEEGMRSLQRIYRTQPAAIEAFLDVKDRLIGKTGSAEVMEHLSMDLQRGTQKMTHVWFGGVAYDDNKMPELVIVVFLKYGAHGKDAAPLTAQIAKKWREIKQKHGVN